MAPKRRERKLPVQQLAILSICRFAEPIASTSLYPYLPEMVESFQVPQEEIGRWAGICAATFSLFQALMGIPWGRFSDKYGRRSSVLLGLTITMLTSLLWGFSTNLNMAIVVRALAGAGNGNIGIMRTTIAEMVPFKELQPRAFSLMPLVWNIGSIFGPTIGGALANPLNIRPGEYRENPSLFEVFPYALPNLVAAGFFLIGITTGFLFLEETLETRQGRKDFGLILGERLTRFFRSHIANIARGLNIRQTTIVSDDEHEQDPLLPRNVARQEEEGLPKEFKAVPASAPTWREVFNKQALINLIAYTLLAMHSMAFDQLIPVFLQHDPIGSPGTVPYHPPLRFAGGFGLNVFQIGLLSTGYGIIGMLIQFFVFPPLARKYGVLFWFKIVACAFPVIYLVTPFMALLPTPKSQVVCIFAVMLLKCLCGIFAFPCSTILLTNSATSLRTLGTLNGFATSASAIGRAAGPALGGAIFTVGVKSGFVIAPWWFVAALAIISVVPVFLLVEGEGFGGEEEMNVEEEDEEIDTQHNLHVIAAEAGASSQGMPDAQAIPFSSSDEPGYDEQVKADEHA